jgi:Fe-S-cluster containining protein
MIEVNCRSCNKHCCGEIPNLTPVFVPSEEKRFKKFSRKVKTPFRDMLVLKKKKNCIFLKDKKCTIYEKRPLECRLYPFLLDFGKQVNVKLDRRFCKRTLVFNKKEIIGSIRKEKFTADWIRGYESLTNF